MAYYMEIAREKVGLPHVFVSHHSGFAYDRFTQQVDKDLEYLFFGPSSNPQATYDRTVLPGKKQIMVGTSVAEWDQYVDLITQAYNLPAYATINIKHSKNADGKLEVNVSGRVKKGDVSDDGNIYLSAYVVEDNISRAGFPQAGVDYDVDITSPSDLKEKYLHQGVIRKNLCTVDLGDKLTIDDEGMFSVTYEPATIDAGWDQDNTHVVAFIHRINKDNMLDNYVLNAADSPSLSGKPASIPAIESNPEALRWVVDSNGRLTITTAIHSARLYDTAGKEIPMTSALANGVYILRAQLPTGAVKSAKILVNR